MKTKNVWMAALVILFPLAAMADVESASYGLARVVRVEPIFRSVEIREPHEQCFREEIRTTRGPYRYNETASTVVGGAIGGLIGNQLGRGHGRIGTTIFGTALGAVLGNSIARSGNDRGEEVEQIRHVRNCREIDEVRLERQIEGYLVDYEYRGEMFRTRLSYRPADRIRVRITVDPVAP